MKTTQKTITALIIILCYAQYNTIAQTAPKDTNKTENNTVKKAPHKNKQEVHYNQYAINRIRKNNQCANNGTMKIGDHVQWKSSGNLHTGIIVGTKNAQICLVKLDNDTTVYEISYKDLQHQPNKQSSQNK